MAASIESRNALPQPPGGPVPEQELILSTLRDFKRDCGEALGIIALGIFGSFARGSATTTSDLDVYVQTKTPNPYLLVHIKDALEGRVHRRVDIVRMRERMNPLLKARIEREGIDV
jgi:predicted nucleotidyltransferase